MGKKLDDIARKNLDTRMTDAEFVVSEIKRFRSSKKYKDMLTGVHYYDGNQDILKKKRTAIGESQEIIEVKNLPNNKIIDNQYAKMVDQKTNYFIGQPFVIKAKNKEFEKALRPYILSKKFFRLLKSLAEDSLNCGISWLFPCYNKLGELVFKAFKPWEIIPEWSDEEHTELDAFIRIFEVVAFEGKEEKTLTKVEVYSPNGIDYFELQGEKLIAEAPYHQSYFSLSYSDGTQQEFNWNRIPLIPFRYNKKENPLINRCKSLQDGLNEIISRWQDQLDEDPRNSIMVLVNYDGTNLGEFRRNLATYGVVKVQSQDGIQGDVKLLKLEINADNYEKVIALFRREIIDNCRGYDLKDIRSGGQPNEINIKSVYVDIELDANGMETEYQASFEELIWFITCHLENTGAGSFENEEYEIIFNRDMLINESAAIDDCRKSVGIISNETIIANHPWVDDPQAEIDKIKKEREAEEDLYSGTFQETADKEETE